jgi:hypothetical protein
VVAGIIVPWAVHRGLKRARAKYAERDGPTL